MPKFRPVMQAAGTQLLLDGSPLFLGTEEQLLDAIGELAVAASPVLVVTPNTAHVRLLETHEGFRSAYAAASLRLVDSAPLAWLSRAVRAPAKRLTGADLLPLTAAVAAGRGWRIAIIGGGSSVAERAAERLRARHPGADIVGLDFPMTRTVPDPQDMVAIKALESVNPHIVFVCLGAPKQELWVHHWLSRLPGAVYIGAGAAVDFIAGNVRRAPSWMQKIGMEWVWRLSQEPTRLAGRYFEAGTAYARLVARSTWQSIMSHARNAS